MLALFYARSFVLGMGMVMFLRTSWTPGPTRAAADVLVALTAFRADRWCDLPGIWRSGLRLRRVWPELDGAVGVWLWCQVGGLASGSVSIWTHPRAGADGRTGDIGTGSGALRRFVAHPEHVATVRRYRGQGQLRSVSWVTSAPPEQIWRHAHSRLTSTTFWDHTVTDAPEGSHPA